MNAKTQFIVVGSVRALAFSHLMKTSKGFAEKVEKRIKKSKRK
jgi:hypothetical protein